MGNLSEFFASEDAAALEQLKKVFLLGYQQFTNFESPAAPREPLPKLLEMLAAEERCDATGAFGNFLRRLAAPQTSEAFFASFPAAPPTAIPPMTPLQEADVLSAVFRLTEYAYQKDALADAGFWHVCLAVVLACKSADSCHLWARYTDLLFFDASIDASFVCFVISRTTLEWQKYRLLRKDRVSREELTVDFVFSFCRPTLAPQLEDYLLAVPPEVQLLLMEPTVYASFLRKLLYTTKTTALFPQFFRALLRISARLQLSVADVNALGSATLRWLEQLDIEQLNIILPAVFTAELLESGMFVSLPDLKANLQPILKRVLRAMRGKSKQAEAVNVLRFLLAETAGEFYCTVLRTILSVSFAAFVDLPEFETSLGDQHLLWAGLQELYRAGVGPDVLCLQRLGLSQFVDDATQLQAAAHRLLQRDVPLGSIASYLRCAAAAQSEFLGIAVTETELAYLRAAESRNDRVANRL